VTRLVGILTGSAIAVALLIVVLGVPELVSPNAMQPDTSALPKQLAYMPQDNLQADLQTKVAPQDEPEPQPEVETAVAMATQTLPVEDEFEDAGYEEILQAPLMQDPLMGEPLIQGTLEQDMSVQEQTDRQWFAFWSPFRSQVAADGFVSHLQRSTGLDYRVVKLKPGVYEVAFAYSDDSDVQDKLTQISAATGLDLSGG